MKNAIAAGSLALALATVGCGAREGRSADDHSGDAARSAQTRPLPEPCSLLTPDELAQQLEPLMVREGHKGLRAQVSTEQLTAAWPVCVVSWDGVDATGNRGYHKDAQIIHVMTPEQWKAQLADMKDMQGKAPTLEPIPGVGDEAFFVDGYPFARVGTTYVGIVFPDRQSALTLLRAAVGRAH